MFNPAPRAEDCQYKNPLPAMPVQRLLNAGAGQAAITRTESLGELWKPSYLGKNYGNYRGTLLSEDFRLIIIFSGQQTAFFGVYRYSIPIGFKFIQIGGRMPENIFLEYMFLCGNPPKR